ncbi:LOW QUALITY PROTEIN: hypothetical protein CVT26_015418 [Gymnopilus dilepis]|uniref:Uncharacterized protein n=1 Tax=Gymnopilus dilepis TaxID=231916 RepID=A0A409YED9_9AGAR|nr:LOW QUALITY PROTEIN: hypothetical protein CVT26_015418 [Gymnopilus dilepis]
MDRLRHMLSGGYWFCKVDKDKFERVQAGENVRSVLRSDPTVQRHLGWSPTPQINAVKQCYSPTPMTDNLAGAVRFEGRKRSPPSETVAPKHATETDVAVLRRGAKVSAPRLCLVKIARLDHGLLQRTTRAGKRHIGRNLEVIAPDHMSAVMKGIIALESFDLGQNRHPDFGLPVLQRPPAERDSYTLLSTKASYQPN